MQAVAERGERSAETTIKSRPAVKLVVGPARLDRPPREAVHTRIFGKGVARGVVAERASAPPISQKLPL